MENYQFKPGSFIKGVDADIAGRYFERLASKGLLTAEKVVDDNRDENAPLHNYFTWDDFAAAEEHRKWQARHLIGSITIVRHEAEPIRGFVKISRSETVYHSIDVVVRQPDMREKLLRMAFAEMDAFQAKYTAFTEFANVFKEMEVLKAQYDGQNLIMEASDEPN